MIDAVAIVERIKDQHRLTKDARVGVVGSYNHKAELDMRGTNRDLVVIATTDDIDEDNEVLVPQGADVSYIAKNAKVFADHNYGVDDVVGAIRSWGAYPNSKNQRGWMARVRLTTNAAGEAVRKIVEETGHIGASIGFEALDYGPPSDEEKKLYGRDGKPPSSIVRKYRLIELSLTALPCNVSCQTMSVVMGDESKSAPLARMVKSGSLSRRDASRFGLVTEHKPKLVVIVGT